jgi:hypothetical protein
MTAISATAAMISTLDCCRRDEFHGAVMLA